MDSNMGGLIKFKVIGVMTSEEFQKCKYYVERFRRNLPDIFAQPEIRAMLDVQWTEFLAKEKRNLGGRLWMLKSPVAVFKNEEYLGDESDLIKYASLNFRLNIFRKFEFMGEKQLQNSIAKSERTYVYFMVAIDDIVQGSLLFELYTDLVPVTCVNFLRLVRRKRKGYKNCHVQRIAKTSWIQVGSCHLKRHRIPCENYIVPHDRRGVLSMCMNAKNCQNSTQFFVSLNPTPWMDYYYVAFGQLVHGENVLAKIEAVPTYYESPNVPITIEDCGEYTFIQEPDVKFIKHYEEYMSTLVTKKVESVVKTVAYSDMEEEGYVEEKEYRELFIPAMNYPDDVVDLRDKPSDHLIEENYLKGLYFLESDKKQYNVDQMFTKHY